MLQMANTCLRTQPQNSGQLPKGHHSRQVISGEEGCVVVTEIQELSPAVSIQMSVIVTSPVGTQPQFPLPSTSHTYGPGVEDGIADRLIKAFKKTIADNYSDIIVWLLLSAPVKGQRSPQNGSF